MYFLEHYEIDDFYWRFETVDETPLAADKTFIGGFYIAVKCTIAK